MMALNAPESGLLVIWFAGVLAVLMSGATRGFTPRTWLTLAAAVVLPILGSALGVTYAWMRRKPRIKDAPA